MPPPTSAVEELQVVGDVLGQHLVQRRDRDARSKAPGGQLGLVRGEEAQPFGREELARYQLRDGPRRLDVDDRVGRLGKRLSSA